MSADLTVVVTAHNETAVCGPTMRAAGLAVGAARQRGYTVETIVGLDAPADATSAYFHQQLFDHWKRRVVHERGAIRNAVAAESDGRYLAFLDAGDLCSENWLAEGVAAVDAAAGRGEHVIAHPELSVVFDGQKMVHINVGQDSPLFTPHYLCFRDYYDSSCIAPREAHLETSYATREVSGAPSHEDRQFTIETMAAGWPHIVVRDTIVFTRRRDLSRATGDNARGSILGPLPATAIDRIRDLGSARR